MRQHGYEGRIKDWKTYGEPEPTKECIVVSIVLGVFLGLALLYIGFGWLLPW